MSSLEVALRGDWLHWDGLEPGLTGARLLQQLGRNVVADLREPAKLALQLCTRQIYHRPNAPLAVTAWFEGVSDLVLLLELDEPPALIAPDTLFAAWGDADRRAPARSIILGAMATEYVYVRRGIALIIAESYDDPPIFAPRIARVQLFAPTDLQGFYTRLGGGDRSYGPG